MSNTPRVPLRISPGDKEVLVLPGTRLSEALAEAGVPLHQPCGGDGKCGKCLVRVTGSVSQATSAEISLLSSDQLATGWRLACQVDVTGPATVEVPAESIFSVTHKILTTETQLARPRLERDDLPLQKIDIALSPPSRDDHTPDMRRLEQAIGRPVNCSLRQLQLLPHLLRQNDFRGSVILADDCLVAFSGEAQSSLLAAAVDIGTTTLVVSLLDVASGQQLALAADVNPQTRFGDDVISRIQAAIEKPEVLSHLQQTVVDGLNALVEKAASDAGIPTRRICQVVVAGNTTMLHLFCGIDPRYLGRLPFTPVLSRGVTLRAEELNLAVHPEAPVYLTPIIGGFVGGDIVAGILATGMFENHGPILLVDIGTNGEIVLKYGDRSWAAATAAGPAFEGARITCGMRAALGAIEQVSLRPRVRYRVIGNTKPAGICGSALIDVVAELLSAGILQNDGRFCPREQLQGKVPVELQERLVEFNGQPAFLLVEGGRTSTGQPILITQHDVRQVQLAAGAIRAGINILLRRAGVCPNDLKKVWLAGGFGNYIRRRNAQRIGLLPQLPLERIQFVGNTSLAGAKLLACSREARRIADRVAETTLHVDLSTDQQFHETFAEAMIFPDSPT